MTNNPIKIAPRSPIAIVRLDDLRDAVQIGQALVAGGIRALEFTLTNPDAAEAIRRVKTELGNDAIVGAGTVLEAAEAQACIDAGAEFLVTPAFLPDVVGAAQRGGVPIVCGAFTATEILAAWRAGASLVKVFPAGGLGPGYVKDVLAPLPFLKLVPTGGINLDNCSAFLDAGAYTVAIGSSLINPELVRRKDWQALTDLSKRFVSVMSTRKT